VVNLALVYSSLTPVRIMKKMMMIIIIITVIMMMIIIIIFLPSVSRMLRDLGKINVSNCRSDHYCGPSSRTNVC